MRTVNEFVAALRATSEAYYADKIDHETLHARQSATWREIEGAGLLAAVREALWN